MAPFSALFDFVTHHHSHRYDRHGMVHVIVDPAASNASSSGVDNSSTHSTFAVDTIGEKRRPLSEECPSFKSTPERPRVSFYHSVRVQLIESLDEYSDDEKAASWYSGVDYDGFKNERKATVDIMESGQPQIDNGQHYFRGAEFKTRKGQQRKQWNVMEASMVVFDEQQIISPSVSKQELVQLIADAYSEVVAESRMAAIERGLFDRRAASEASEASFPK